MKENQLFFTKEVIYDENEIKENGSGSSTWRRYIAGDFFRGGVFLTGNLF